MEQTLKDILDAYEQLVTATNDQDPSDTEGITQEQIDAALDRFFGVMQSANVANGGTDVLPKTRP